MGDETKPAATQGQAGEQGKAGETGGDAAAKAAADAAAKAAAGEQGKTGEQGKGEQGGGTTAGQPPASYTLKLPEGSVLGADFVERMSTHAKGAGLSQEAAQKHAEHVASEVMAFQTAKTTEFQKLARETWPAEIEADKEIGGANYKGTLTSVKRVSDRFLTVEEKQKMDESGWGNHPMLVRIFERIGKAMGEDGIIVPGGGSGAGEKTAAQKLYGGTTPAGTT